jgi:diacylglycerol kinase (ATP)
MYKKSILYSVSHATDGLLHCLRTQKHMRVHFALAMLAMLAAALLQVAHAEFLALIFSVTLVIVAEMFNTGVEVVVDLVQPNYDPRARIVKDIAAGAVLLSGLSAAVIGALVFIYSPVAQSFIHGIPFARSSSVWSEVGVEGLLVLFIVTLAWKVGKRGLSGPGAISGRTAFAFFAMLLVVINPSDEVRLLAALLMAALLIYSSAAARSYSMRQVVLGAVVGILVPGVVFAAHYAVSYSGLNARLNMGPAASSGLAAPAGSAVGRPYPVR